MGVLDGPMKAVAKTLADTFGKSATLKRDSDTYNTSSRTVTTTTTDYSVTGVVEQFNEHLVDGDVIQNGDQKFTIPAKGLSIDPDPETDRVVLDGITYSLVGVKRIYSGSDEALWELHLRS